MFQAKQVQRAASALGYSVRRVHGGDIRVAPLCAGENVAAYVDSYIEAAQAVRAFVEHKAKQEAAKDTAPPSIDEIMRFEGGEMDDSEIVTFFQCLINSGLAWRLQGSYGRSARRLIEVGLCHA